MTSVHQAGVRRILSLLLAFILVFSVCAIPALADEAGDSESASADGSSAIPQPTVDFYVYDEANVLSAETESALLQQCAALNAEYGAQIVVMTLDTMPGTTSAERVAYAEQVIAQWKIGGDAGNGLLLVLSISDADYWAVAAQNFKENFSNSVLSKMLKECLEPDFANQAYDAGVTKFVQTAAESAKTYLEAQKLKAETQNSEVPSADNGETGQENAQADKKGGNAFIPVLKGIGIFLLVVLALLIVFFIVVYVHGQILRKKRRNARRRRTQSRSGGSANTRRVSAGQTAERRQPDSDEYRAFMDRYK